MYLTLKFLHIFAVIMFLGNITTGLFWHRQAARTRNAALFAHTMDGIIRSDRWFTIPGVTAIVAIGVAMAIDMHLPILSTRWILWTLVALSVSGIIFAVWLIPLQRKMHAFAREGVVSGNFDYAAYHRLAQRWEAWGLASLLLPYIGLAFMVFRPAL